MSDVLKLFCFIYHHGNNPAYARPFPVNIAKTDTVGDLKKVIKAEMPSLAHIGASELCLWKIEIVYDANFKTLVNEFSFEQAEPSPLDQLDTLFPEQPRNGIVSILVQLPLEQEARDKVPDMVSLKAKERKNNALSPSDAAKPGNIASEQSKHPIQNGRPEENRGHSVTIYSKDLAVLADKIRNLESIEPSAKTLQVTHQLFDASVGFFKDEKARVDKMNPLIGALLGRNIETHNVGIARADGCILHSIDAETTAPLGLFEYKVEPGSGSDPGYQVQCTYAKHGAQNFKLGYSTCIPCVLFAIMGPYICIMGAITVNGDVISQPFTDYIFLGEGLDYEERVVRVARIFHATSEAIRDLKKYYRNVVLHNGVNPMMGMPCPVLADGTNLPGLEFISKLGSSGRSPVFLGKMNGADVFVKFARKYCEAVHKLLADHDLAPKLHSCVRICGGLFMVIMDYVVGSDALQVFDEEILSPPVLADVRRAIEVLHNEDLVFGDLRLPNIMVVKDGKGALLVDFDWCGKVGEARYPATLNDNLNWHEGVKRHGLITKEHDIFRLNDLEGNH